MPIVSGRLRHNMHFKRDSADYFGKSYTTFFLELRLKTWIRSTAGFGKDVYEIFGIMRSESTRSFEYVRPL